MRNYESTSNLTNLGEQIVVFAQMSATVYLVIITVMNYFDKFLQNAEFHQNF